jgi:hypothetical protein
MLLRGREVRRLGRRCSIEFGFPIAHFFYQIGGNREALGLGDRLLEFTCIIPIDGVGSLSELLNSLIVLAGSLWESHLSSCEFVAVAAVRRALSQKHYTQDRTVEIMAGVGKV